MTEAPIRIAELEAEIEILAERAERCRRTILLARFGALSGAILLAALVVGVLTSGPVLVVGALAALVGGLALSGSGHGTLAALHGAIAEREGARNRLIDGMALERVGAERA